MFLIATIIIWTPKICAFFLGYQTPTKLVYTVEIVSPDQVFFLKMKNLFFSAAGDLVSFSKLAHHYTTEYQLSENLFVPATRPLAVSRLYDAAGMSSLADQEKVRSLIFLF